MAKQTVKIELDGTPPQVAAQKKALEVMSKLPAADRMRLLEIAQSPDALKGLEENWSMLSTMFKK